MHPIRRKMAKERLTALVTTESEKKLFCLWEKQASERVPKGKFEASSGQGSNAWMYATIFSTSWARKLKADSSALRQCNLPSTFGR